MVCVTHTHTHTSPSQPACCLVPQLLAVSPSGRGDQAPDFPSCRKGRGREGVRKGGGKEGKGEGREGREGGREGREEEQCYI